MVANLKLYPSPKLGERIPVVTENMSLLYLHRKEKSIDERGHTGQTQFCSASIRVDQSKRNPVCDLQDCSMGGTEGW